MTPSFPTRRSSDLVVTGQEKGPTRASTLLFLCGCYIRRNHLFVRIDRLRRLNYADVNQHRIDVRDRIDVIDLAIAELEPGKPDDVQFIAGGLNAHIRRSEEHTSELQSLMRISYAVFCLKKIN